MLSHLIEKVRSYISNQVLSFRRCWEQIASSNLHILQVTSTLSASLLFVIAVYTLVRGTNIRATQIYIIGFLFYTLYAVLIHRFRNRLKWRTRLIRLICLLFTLSLLCLGILSAVAVNQCGAAIAYAAISIALLGVFIFPLWQGIAIATLTTVTFVALGNYHEALMGFHFDIASGVILWVLSVATHLLVLDMRLKEFSMRHDLVRLSSRDSLTGLLNKATAETEASAYLSAHAGHAMAALFVIDMDQFKEINDLKGHKAGDEALELFGNLLLKLFRSQDIVGRVGGDEFVALMKNTADRKLIKRRAELICDTVRSQLQKSTGLSLTCSIGIAISPAHGVNYDALFSKADEQLYHIKRSGKNGFRIA